MFPNFWDGFIGDVMVLGAGPLVFFHVVAGVLSSVYTVEAPQVKPTQLVQKERKKEIARAFGTAGEGLPSKKAGGSEGFELPARGSTPSDRVFSSEQSMISLNQPSSGNLRPFERAADDSSQSLRKGSGAKRAFEEPQNFQESKGSSTPSFPSPHAGVSDAGSSGVSAKMKSKAQDSVDSSDLVGETSRDSSSPAMKKAKVAVPAAAVGVNPPAAVVVPTPPPPPPPASMPGAPPPPAAGNAGQPAGVQGLFNQIKGGKQLKKTPAAQAAPMTPAEELAQRFKAGKSPLGANRPKVVAQKPVQVLSPHDEIIKNTASIDALRNKLPGLQAKEIEARDAGKDSRSFKTQITNTLKQIKALEDRNTYLDRTIRGVSKLKKPAAGAPQATGAPQAQAPGQAQNRNTLSADEDRDLQAAVGNASVLYALLSDNEKYSLSQNRDLVEKLTLLTDAEIAQISGRLAVEPASMRYTVLRNEGILFLMDVDARKADVPLPPPPRDETETAALLSEAPPPPPPPAEEEEVQVGVKQPAVVQPNVAEPIVEQPVVVQPAVVAEEVPLPPPPRDEVETAALLLEAPPPPPAEEEEVQVGVNQPAVVQPNVAEPIVEQPVVVQPAVNAEEVPLPPPPRDEVETAALLLEAPPPPPAEEEEVQVGVNQPAVVQPNVAEPIVEQPVVNQPAEPQEVIGQPAANQPVEPQEVVEQPVVGQPVANQPALDVEPFAEQHVLDAQPVEEIVEQPVIPAPPPPPPAEAKPLSMGGVLAGISSFLGFKKKAPQESAVVEKPKAAAPVVEEPQGIFGGLLGNISNFVNRSLAKQQPVPEVEEFDWGDDEAPAQVGLSVNEQALQQAKAEEQERAVLNAAALRILEEKRAQKVEEDRLKEEKNKKPEPVVEPVVEARDEEEAVGDGGAPSAPPPPPEEVKEKTPANKPVAQKKEASTNAAPVEKESLQDLMAKSALTRRAAIHHHDEDDDSGVDDY